MQVVLYFVNLVIALALFIFMCRCIWRFMDDGKTGSNQPVPVSFDEVKARSNFANFVLYEFKHLFAKDSKKENE